MIVPATRLIICLTERSRSGEPSWPRKYFWATMFVAFCDQRVGNSTSCCSKAMRSPWPMRASRISHSTRVERVNAGRREEAVDRKRLAGRCLLGECWVCGWVHRAFLLCCCAGAETVTGSCCRVDHAPPRTGRKRGAVQLQL